MAQLLGYACWDPILQNLDASTRLQISLRCSSQQTLNSRLPIKAKSMRIGLDYIQMDDVKVEKTVVSVQEPESEARKAVFGMLQSAAEEIAKQHRLLKNAYDQNTVRKAIESLRKSISFLKQRLTYLKPKQMECHQLVASRGDQKTVLGTANARNKSKDDVYIYLFNKIFVEMILKTNDMIFVLFILIVSFASADDDATTTTTAPVPVPRQIPEEEYDQFVTEVNQKRREFAKEHGIANMHELMWNQQLAELVAADAGESFIKNPEEKNYVYHNDFNHFLTSIDIMIDALQGDLEKGSKENDYNDEITLLSPVHREIGCADGIAADYSFYKMCYLTPGALIGIDSNSWEAAQEIVSVKGEPGSQCYQGYGNNDGLCSLPSTTTTEESTAATSTTTPEPTTTTTEATTTEEPTPIPEEPFIEELPKLTPDVKDVPAPDAPKPQSTQRPSPVPEKQTFDEKKEDSGESEDVKESEESASSTFVSLYSVLVYILLVLFYLNK